MAVYKSFSQLTDNTDTRVELYSATAMPKASSFLWNPTTLLQMNCRGYAVAQFMQPEPAKYSYAPNMEAKTFMQPEQSYYAHHPGRFFYIKDNNSGKVFSAPYEPMRSSLDKFVFTASPTSISWCIEKLGIQVDIQVSLALNEPIEHWQISVTNLTSLSRDISIYPYFTIGYMSWMNQGARFNPALNSIVARSITPYQQIPDYYKQQDFADITYLLADTPPDAWCSNQGAFEGDGGLHNPDALKEDLLNNEQAHYETPVAVLQYQRQLAAHQSVKLNFLFGPAKTEQDITDIRTRYFFKAQGLERSNQSYKDYVNQGQGCLTVQSPDKAFDDFVNHWLPRQMFYHGDVHRLSTDPQTRNFLQDTMGMSYISPQKARSGFIKALSQQSISGSMPDGVLMHAEAELKYINKVPHTDHNVWLPICLSAYLDETNDTALLEELVGFVDSEKQLTVQEHVDLALKWLLLQRDERGLSLIANGDWCDPMNMVGHKGKGVSAWLSLALAYALNLCERYQLLKTSIDYKGHAQEINQAVNTYLWDGQWFGRGITDDGVFFGVSDDKEGCIYLNPQSWAMLSGAAKNEKIEQIIAAVEVQLMSPFGVMMLAPSYTQMREDVGRLTQKYPGTAENGSVYNHAAVFYAFSLYQAGKNDLAFTVLNKMLIQEGDVITRGQLPIFIPNYYRGAYHQIPEKSGRSSQLFNTGTIAWFYRCLVEGLCGLKGDCGELIIEPKLPSHWPKISVKRKYLGAHIELEVNQQNEIDERIITVNGQRLLGNRLGQIVSGKHYKITVQQPKLPL